MRAKLTGSNTAMGRFMVQLFGTKQEPWVDGGDAGVGVGTGDALAEGRRRDRADTELSDEHIDNEQTTLHERDPDRSRLETVPGGPLAEALPPRTTPPSRPPPVSPDAASWANDASYPPRERRSSQRPVAQPEARTSARMEAVSTTTLLGQATAIPAPLRPAPPLKPPSGSAPAVQLPAPDEASSEPGARPLVDDPKLGWETSPSNRLMAQAPPVGTRLDERAGLPARLEHEVARARDRPRARRGRRGRGDRDHDLKRPRPPARTS